MATYVRRGILFVSITSIYSANSNLTWEKKMKEAYRSWAAAHEDYRGVIKTLSKTQSDKMNIAGRSLSGKMATVISPHEMIREVINVQRSYKGIHQALISDLMVETKRSTTSQVLPADVVNRSVDESDYLLFENPETSVEVREEILKKHTGLRNSYKTFAIALASQKESISRQALMAALDDRPITFLFTADSRYYWNTTGMFRFGVLGSGLSGIWIASSDSAAIMAILAKILK